MCRSTGKNQARVLPTVHPGYSSTASGGGSKGKAHHPLSAALYLQQCLSGDSQETDHQPIDGLIPAFRLHRSVGRREKKEIMNCMTKRRVENIEGSLGYPWGVRLVFTKDSKPLKKRTPRDPDFRSHLKKMSPLKGP
ncbi:hypothetical protein TNCV_3780771 [Trichonephila clavipes]|nr:hypothetical protein TNCV_3780771 [Trichonephila clavipes]